MKKIMIAAASSGAGKTTITLGLMCALQERGLSVQPYKVGPDYVDTQYHTRITGRASRNLDMYLVPDEKVLRSLFEKEASKADIAVIEGVMGLYDGLGSDKNCCTSAAIAKKLNCPIVLVIDGKAASTSVAAVVKGFVDFDPDLTIIGVIINNVASEGHYYLIKKAITRYTKVQVFGYLKREPSFALPSRQLGLVPNQEIDGIVEKIKDISQRLQETVAIDQLLSCLRDETIAPALESRMDFSDLTIAYAQDKAFHFYYEDNLEALRNYNVALRTFSPLKDSELPPADLYYIGGGYPEEFAAELARNRKMAEALLAKHHTGVPILAECGGLMYLGETLLTKEGAFSMVGIFKGTSRMTNRLKRFGYCKALASQDTLIAKKDEIIRGHEFHHSVFESSESPVFAMSKERDGIVVKRWWGGYQKNNTFASYIHLHFYQQPQFLEKLLQKVRESRKNI